MSADLKLGGEVKHAVDWFDKPEPILLDALTQNFVGLLFLTGIVNPFGPTMMGLVVLSKVPLITATSPIALQIARFFLNPFAHDVEAIGQLVGPFLSPDELVTNVDRLGYDGTGRFTLFHPGYHYADHRTAGQLGRALLFRVEGVAEELNLLKRFPNDPWHRISVEMDGVTQQVRDHVARRKLQPIKEYTEQHQSTEQHHAPTSEDVESFLEIIQREEHNAEELKAFFTAWLGAIKNVPPATFSDVLTLEMIINIHAHLVAEPESQKGKTAKRATEKVIG